MKARARGVLVVMTLAGCEHVSSSIPRDDAGEAAHQAWTSFDAGPVNLNAVSGAGENEVLIVGDGGTIVRWNGTAVAPESSGTGVNLRGVWAVDPDHAYAVGDGGTILERTGGRWATIAVGVTNKTLTAVWADAQRVVAVGEQGVIVTGSGGSFALVPNDGNENLFAVTGAPGGGIIAVGARGVILRLENATLTRTPIAGFTKQLAGATTTPDATYLVGVEGTVLKSSGATFAPIDGFPPYALRSVAAPGAELWVVGFEGMIARWTGGKVTKVTPPDGRWLTGIYAPSPSTVWIVGRSGLLMRGSPPSL
jgi:photosystem II stability/assembly factor-like uncharacterized protein